MPDVYRKTPWEGSGAARAKARDRGEVQVTRNVSRIQLSAPYSEDFRQAAHDLNGRWRKKTQVWSFNDMSWPRLRAAVLDIYGVELGERPPD